ncbi:hypothetical protein P9875_15190 [Janthinobacterium rivuli]|uniref:Uncharacterized protein n=1 Tax=Janthinobacterium rivuli TaxID=2751478 RepID=A0ABY8HZ44_9BURK|nr:hypothetical protein [Janthinobacterium rivuli]WFR77067.1 hypothetical protein P9875_15190 [Janthinobacterium rivuli]
MSATVLTYVLSPATAVANSRVNFTLVASNGGAKPLQLTPNDEIYICLPVGSGATDLTADLSTVNTGAPASWRCSKNASAAPYNFLISPSQNVTLAAGAFLAFEFNAVVINLEQGNVSVLLDEFIGAGQAKTSFPVSKSVAVLSIVAQAVPQIVGLGQSTTLKWTAAKAAYVTISPLPNQYKTIDQLVTTPSKDVAPGAVQVAYTFYAWTPSQEFARDIVVVTISAPVVESFEPKNSPAINYFDTVTLSWNVDYAQTVQLTTDTGVVQVGSSGSLPVQPYNRLQGNSATYTLRATGLGQPVLAQIDIPFKPVTVDYFRYPAFGVTNTYQVGVSNGVWQVDQFTGYFRLTASGAYGPVVQYLGDYPSLQVQVFLASADSVAAGTAVTLQWQTSLALSANLGANGVSRAIASDQVAKGSVVVNPAVTTDYVLSVSDANGNIVTSSLSVVVSPS